VNDNYVESSCMLTEKSTSAGGRRLSGRQEAVVGTLCSVDDFTSQLIETNSRDILVLCI